MKGASCATFAIASDDTGTHLPSASRRSIGLPMRVVSKDGTAMCAAFDIDSWRTCSRGECSTSRLCDPGDTCSTGDLAPDHVDPTQQRSQPPCQSRSRRVTGLRAQVHKKRFQQTPLARQAGSHSPTAHQALFSATAGRGTTTGDPAATVHARGGDRTMLGGGTDRVRVRCAGVPRSTMLGYLRRSEPRLACDLGLDQAS